MSTRRAKKFLEQMHGKFTFGEFLRAARASQGRTQVEMANFLGISKSTLCDLEKGRQSVSPKLASGIARKCGLSEIIAIESALNDSLRRFGLTATLRPSNNRRSA